MSKNFTTNTIFASDSSIRISTSDIDEAIQQLENAFTEGRLDDSELEDRMDQALKAKTEHDLAMLLRDLERAEQTVAATYEEKPLYRLKDSSIAIFSGFEKTGHFILPKNYRIMAVFGGCMIDLSKAQLESPYTTIRISAVFGGVQIFAPRGVRVEVDGMPIMGGIAKNIDEEPLPKNAPVIQIHAKAIFGGIEVKTKK